MGMWSIVKKAINSKNPADADYKSLSELVDEVIEQTGFKKSVAVMGTLNEKINYLITQNLGGIALVASDEKQEIFFTTQKSYNAGYTDNIIAVFTPKVSGSVKLTFDVRKSTSASSAYCTTAVSTSSSFSGNNVAIDSYEGKNVSNRSLTFNVSANTSYYIYFGQSGGTNASITNYINNLALNYTIDTPKSVVMTTTTR